MNSDLLRWLLDVDVIPAGAESVELVWERPWPAWLWIGFIVATAVYAGWSYSRLDGRRAGRALLAGARSVLILLVLLVISGPMLELPRETIEEDWVVVLADRSASMTIPDGETSGAGRVTRDEQLRRLVAERDDVWRRLDEDREVIWMGFHAGAFNLDVQEGTDESNPRWTVDLGDSVGRRTNLNTALSQALQRAAGRPLAGVVVLSDGRTENPPDSALLRRLRADAVPVFAVPLGSDEPIGDLAVRRVEAPRRAFVRDKVPVVVELDRLGSAAARLTGTVKLIDEATGEEIDSVELNGTGGADGDRVTLTAEPQLAGEASWRVVVETDRGDLLPDNNSKAFGLELIDRPLRVLLVDGYPRWEYRYLKNLLIREESIDSSIMLLSADRDFAQEGNQPITRVPRSPEEFAEFDVIILGDVPGSFFSADQLEMMRNQVGGRGAGLLWVGGPRSTPRSYTGKALADLLPMRGSLELPRLGEPVNMQPTPLAERLGVMQLATAAAVGWPRELVDPDYGWSRLFYAQRIEPGRLKPAAEVLAETVQALDGTQFPLVVHMRYGSGQSIYVATDEIWRWRYGRGELLPEQFWLQLIRMLGRESLSQSGEAAVLTVTPRRAQTGQPLRIALRVLDAQLAGTTRRGMVRAVIEREDDSRPVAEIELRAVEGSDAEFAATYIPDAPGRLRVRIDDRSLAGVQLDASAEVFSPDDELRRPETDHALLASLTEATGGTMLDVKSLPDLPALLPNRSVRTLNPLSERVWDTPLAFGLILLTLTAEWIGRKVLRLA